MVGGGKGKLACPIIEEQFKNLLLGRDPFDIELLWEQMFRASQFYGRKGAVIEVMSVNESSSYGRKRSALATTKRHSQ